MKNGPCPRCQGRDVYEIDEACQADYQSSNATYPLTLTARYGPSGETGLFGMKNTRVEVRVEAYVCASCGYTELYAKDLELLARLSAKPGSVRKVTRQEAATPAAMR